MQTPVEIVLAHHDQLRQRDALQAASEQVVDAYVRVFGQIAGHVRELQTLAERHGMDNLMAGLPEDVRTAVLSSIDQLRALYAACSPHPFPELPAEPLPDPEPEASE